VGDHRGPSRARHLAALVASVVVLGGSVVLDADVAATAETSKLVAIGPLRLADTRLADCGCRRLAPDTFEIDVTGREAIPDDAVAAAITVTALPTDPIGHVTVWPSGRSRPEVSTVNTRADRVVANSAIVPLGDGGGLTVFGLGAGDVVVDLTAVFVPTSTSTAGRYVPMTPTRVADTRTTDPPSGAVASGGSLEVPLPGGVPADATALIVNVTSVLEARPGHLSVRPSASSPRETSFMNLDGSGTATAASVIVPVDAGGFAIDSFAGGHLVVDVLGWFTGPGAPDRGDGLYVPFGPRRLLDTRLAPGRIHAGGTIEVVSPVGAAAAIVTNATVVLPDRRGHVTAYPARTPVPATSTVNPSFWNHTVANFAVTRTSTAGMAYRSYAGTDLVVDATGWFTGTPVGATEDPAPNDADRERAVVVGDSSLAVLVEYPPANHGFQGFEIVVDAAACRRLMKPSCLSDFTGLIPNTAVEAIASTPGQLDVVIVKTGFNDWFNDFPAAFDAVVRTSRAKGAHTILWLTYNETSRSVTGRRAYHENNVDLRRLAALPQYRDVVVADWQVYADGRPDWFWDGIHLTPDGAWALTDYVSRWMAALAHRPCPQPWTPGAPIPDPCPAPEQLGPVPNPRGLY
jgi:hypothetical protein